MGNIMKVMKRVAAVVLGAALVMGLTACGGGSSAPATQAATTAAQAQAEAPKETEAAKHDKIDIQLLGASSTLSNAAVAIADTVTNNSSFVRMSAIGTTNSEANITQMMSSDPKTTLYMTSAAPYVSARAGAGLFAESGAIDNQRMIAGFLYGANGLVTLDENIKSIEDLNGKTIAMFADELPQQVAKAAFEILGIDVTIRTMGFADQFTALSDGLVDACLYLGTGNPSEPLIPVGPLQELVTTKKNKVYPISFPEDLQKQAVEKAGIADVWPYSPVTALPGSLSPEQTESFELYGSATVCLACFDGADEDVIYEITKQLCENTDQLGQYLTELKGIDASAMLSLLHMIQNEDEIHPGARKYYQEIGLLK